MGEQLLCNRHPIFYTLSVTQKRLCRYMHWWLNSGKFCREKSMDRLPTVVKSHKSLLMRKLGSSDVQLQRNKVTNLSLAIKHIDGILIKPGERFSFYKLVGMATRKKGYLEGMLLHAGEVRPGIGGGLCQLTNLIHWMILHSPLTVIERHHHSFDPFPDEGRLLPFGSGATVFYNYIDYQFENSTPYTFQLRIWITDEHLKGELRCSEELSYSYHVFERDHRFLKKGSRIYRQNSVLRNVIDRKTGDVAAIEPVAENFAEVKYDLPPDTHVELIG